MGLQPQFSFPGLLLLWCSSCAYRSADIACCICSHLLLSSVGTEGTEPFVALSLEKYVYSSEKVGELINTCRNTVQRENMRMQKVLVLRHEILTFLQPKSLKSLYKIMFKSWVFSSLASQVRIMACSLM